MSRPGDRPLTQQHLDARLRRLSGESPSGVPPIHIRRALGGQCDASSMERLIRALDDLVGDRRAAELPPVQGLARRWVSLDMSTDIVEPRDA